jgi:hypothetical protein
VLTDEDGDREEQSAVAASAVVPGYPAYSGKDSDEDGLKVEEDAGREGDGSDNEEADGDIKDGDEASTNEDAGDNA